MDHHHHNYSSEHEDDIHDHDDYEYSMKSSAVKNLAHTFYSPGHQPPPESTVLNFEDIISDESTLEFLLKHFSGEEADCIDIELFLDILLQEFFLRNPSLTSTIEDIETFRFELREALKNRLTTNDAEVVSLNALEVNTKKKGLYEFVFDLAINAQSSSKLKKSTQINEAIMEELSVVSQMLNSKKLELNAYENRLKKYEQSLVEREKEMKKVIKAEYEKLFKSFDESYKHKVNDLQKRLTTHEKTTRTKIKQYETQVKDIKSAKVSMSGNEEKFKYKISSLEKTNDFLKLKAQDLEKKLHSEQEAKQTMTQRNQKLQNKVSLLEKSVKEGAGSLLGSQSLHKHREAEPVHVARTHEKPLEVVDLNTTQQYEKEDTEYRGRSMSPGEFDEEVEEDEIENIAMKPKKVTAAGKTGTALKASVSQRKTGKQAAVIETSPPATAVKKVAVKTGPSSEVKVLLNVVHSLIVCLKSTLPIFVSNKGEEESQPKERRTETGEDRVPVDLGEIFYPCFDSLVGNLTELLPILAKQQYDAKYTASVVEVYYKLINFFFKFKVQHRFDHINAEHRLLSEYEIQNSTNKIKSMQDHVNEIMVATSQQPKEKIEINLVPQTEYWKKIVKASGTKPSVKSKIGVDLQSSVMNSLGKNAGNKPGQQQVNKPETYISLFTEEGVQKEILAILKKYLDATESMLKNNEGSGNVDLKASTISLAGGNGQLGVEAQKYVQVTRLYTSLTAILLAKTKKEQVVGLQSLMVDLNIENIKIVEFLRTFLIENDGLNVLFWVIRNNMYEFDVVQEATDILLSLNYNGAHYRAFMETISQEDNIGAIFDVLMKHGENNEFCEKMSVIVQRITYHNSLQGMIPDRYIRFLKEKLEELEGAKDSQFFMANIKSILSNLQVL